MSTDKTCASCKCELEEPPFYFVSADPERIVCSPNCAFALLRDGVVVGEFPPCIVCGEEYDAGRVPRVEGYDEEMCASCARQVEVRAPRGQVA